MILPVSFANLKAELITVLFMSGHSKWATTKRQKAVVDAKRSANFTKIANLVSIAARKGGDPAMNFSLRIAVDKAKEVNMPKENIERAIKRGTGEIAGGQLEESIYEGYGPDKIAFIMEIITDNKNRASSEIRHLLSKAGGSLGGPGSVMWQFDQKGIIDLQVKELTDDQQLSLIDAGADDFDSEDDHTIVLTHSDKLELVKKACEALGFKINSAGLEYVPKEYVKPTDLEALQNFFNQLEDNNDISNYYHNAEI